MRYTLEKIKKGLKISMLKNYTIQQYLRYTYI